MEIVSSKEEMIFRNEYEGKVSYKIGLSKKNKEGQFDKGYIPVRFKQGVELNNQTRILIKEAWLSFAKYENKTYPYIFINDFNIVDKGIEKKETSPFEEFGKQIELEESELPF